MIITIDGLASVGKGTIARRLAQHYEFEYLDTGLFFRSVAQILLDKGGSPHQESDVLQAFQLWDWAKISQEHLLRTEDVSRAASIISALPFLRASFVDVTRAFSTKYPNIICDGRDMGTIVFPNAERKIFLTASLSVRAARRYADLSQRGAVSSQEDVLVAMRQRDQRDSQRSLAPTKPADDAFILDNGNLSVSESLALCISFIEKR